MFEKEIERIETMLEGLDPTSAEYDTLINRAAALQQLQLKNGQHVIACAENVQAERKLDIEEMKMKLSQQLEDTKARNEKRLKALQIAATALGSAASIAAGVTMIAIKNKSENDTGRFSEDRQLGNYCFDIIKGK